MTHSPRRKQSIPWRNGKCIYQPNQWLHIIFTVNIDFTINWINFSTEWLQQILELSAVKSSGVDTLFVYNVYTLVVDDLCNDLDGRDI